MSFDDKQTIEPFLGQALDQVEDDSIGEFASVQNNFAPSEQQLAVDVYEDEDNLYVKSPLPGVKPENLEINIDGEILTIQGNSHEDFEQKTANFFCRECNWGSFSRSIVLPMAVASDRISAALANGILTVTLPKIKQ
jgi:HSP20 family molecular chaperone IbpA